MYYTVIIITSFFIKAIAIRVCSNESPAAMPKYYLIEKCHRSKLGVAAKANFTSLTSCKRLGIEKRALAINFSPQEYLDSGEILEYSCEVLKCAEAIGGLSLSNDTRYDYYSIYAKPLPTAMSTCVPATGMFLLLPKKLNQTQAQARCQNISAVLADVTSEQRTEVLAQVLATASVDSAYVGMERDIDGIFYKTNGDALECITYRAWAPGHPKRKSNVTCVLLTRNRMWKTTACEDKYPALCELIPDGPYKRGSIFASRTQNSISHVLYKND
ncbi:uncharacterized protein LOC124530914 [Vanessa cardui]|uniref:uncharacterized protein LOC124530914 n=1 Tax=Vanessa cardui TaxID=171605 RepID=UPI001F13F890|nr:uncharacterized protein LOC124530914 [Vanessa cardui]